MRKLNLLLKSLLLLYALIVGSSSAWADNTYTIGWGNATGENSKNFDATSGTVTDILSFSCEKNSSGTNPAYNSNSKQLRLYFHNGGAGGSITLTPLSGAKITSAVITSATNPSVKYSVDGGDATSVSAVGEGEPYTYTISEISASSSLKIQNVNTSNTQLRITTIEITYTVSGTPSISFEKASKQIGTGCSYTQTATTANIGTNTVSYTSNNTNVAIVNSSTGEVTGVAAGTATITASVTVGGTPYSANYSINVVNVPDGTFDFTTGYDYGSGLEPSDAQNKASTPYTFTAGNITITTAGTGNFLWNSDFRLYANSSAVISAPDGYIITQIVFTGSGMTSGTIDGVAFPNGTSTTWTGKKQSVTIARNTATVTIKTITVTYEEKGNKETATASIDATKIAIAGGTPTFANITTVPAGLVVSYSSDNPSVATVSDAGVVTPVAADTAKITVSWAEQKVGGTTYEAGSQVFNVIVYQMEDGVFNFECGLFDYGSEVPFSTGDYVTEKKTWTSGSVTLETTGKYRWWNADKTLRFYANQPNSTMTFKVPDDKVITKIVITGGQNFEAEGYSSGKWNGAQQSVSLSYTAESKSADVKTVTVYYSTPTYNITMAPEGYMTYCNRDAAISFGDGLEAFVVSAVDTDNEKVTLTPITKAPAGTPIVLKGEAGEKTLTIEASADAVASNMLYRSNGSSAKNTDTRNVYALAKKNDVVGFYKLKDDVIVPAGKCYLSVAKVAEVGARDFLGFVEEDATSINSLTPALSESEGAVYDLQGRQVIQPTKGLYIKNGKKVIIK